MDPLTAAVRDLYEAYPYPSGAPTIRVGFDARYVLSKVARARETGGTLRVLDAGCGRGLGVLGAATLQPDIELTGIDLNRVALAEARSEAERRGLSNARFLEVDVQTLDGLEVPEGGFDVVYSSGVIHHLADPIASLERLGRVLAPHGVLVLMVYGNRQPMERVAAAIAAALPDGGTLNERLVGARALVRELHERHPEDATWKSAAEVDEVEFVDRYLHPCERSYTVDELFATIEEAGLAFLDWAAPEEWNVAPERELDPRDRWRLAERVHRPGKLEVHCCRPENGRRAPLRVGEVGEAALAVNPEVVFELERRGTLGASRVERIATRLRGAEPVAEGPGPVASALLAVSEATEPFLGRDLTALLASRGVPADAAQAAVVELIARDVLYAPHLVDILPGEPDGSPGEVDAASAAQRPSAPAPTARS